jgi:hypothetical protein
MTSPHRSPSPPRYAGPRSARCCALSAGRKALVSERKSGLLAGKSFAFFVRRDSKTSIASETHATRALPRAVIGWHAIQRKNRIVVRMRPDV